MQLKLSLLLLVCRTINGSPSPYSKKNEVAEYEDYDNSDMKSDNDNEVQVWSTPKFQTNSESLLVNEGDTVRLPCYVDKLEGFVMLWKRNKDIVTVGSQIIDKNLRLEESSNGNTLVIGPASPNDEAEYTCQISAYKPTEITHKLKIRVKPVVQISPSDHLIVNEGDSAQMSCSLLAGSPTPHLTWTRRSLAMPGGAEEVAGGRLSFTEVTRHHAGHYVCSADNGFGPTPVTAQIKLTVHHSPAVEPLVSEVYSGLGLEEELECVVHSSPRAVVLWSRDGQVLDNNMDNLVIRQESNRHILSLSMQSQEMFGTYKCQASNELGSAHSSVKLTGLASPATLTSADVSLYTDTYTLAWYSDSKSEITSFRVQYRVARGEPGWTEVEVVPRQASIDSQGGGRWEGSALLSHLSPATQYEAQVLPRNFFGYTQPTQVFNFATKGAVPYHQPSTSASQGLHLNATLILCLLLVLVR